MDVRCRGCQAEVSEWAALCPVCRRSLDDAELLPEPDPPPAPLPPPEAPPEPVAEDDWDEEESEEIPPPRTAVGRRAALAVAAAAALIGTAIGVVALSGGGHPRHIQSAVSATQPNEGPVVPSSLVPPDVAGERMYFAEPGMTGLYQTNGLELSKISVEGDGFPLEPLVSGLGIVVYIHDGHAYRTSVDASAPTTELGPATWIFPGLNGSIGIENGTSSGASTIQYMTPDGGFDPSHFTTLLPANETAIAQVPLGLVVASGADLAVPINEVDHLRISLVMHRKSGPAVNGVVTPATEYLGAATAIIGEHGPTVAWIRCPGDESVNCSLFLMNTTDLYVREVPEPRNSAGFAQGGGFSPDGSQLAVFVRSGIADGGTVLHLEVYNVAAGTLKSVGPLLPAEEPDGSATWSLDGLYLYFGGLLGNLYAEPTSAIGSGAKPIKLPLGTSFSVVGY